MFNINLPSLPLPLLLFHTRLDAIPIPSLIEFRLLAVIISTDTHTRKGYLHSEETRFDSVYFLHDTAFISLGKHGPFVSLGLYASSISSSSYTSLVGFYLPFLASHLVLFLVSHHVPTYLDIY